VKLISSRDFNQDVSRAKRMARIEPVFVTDRGKPTHVLLGIEDWRRLSGEKESLVDLLAAPDLPEIDAGPGAAATWSRSG
jgi:prevent-host-death family protein